MINNLERKRTDLVPDYLAETKYQESHDEKLLHSLLWGQNDSFKNFTRLSYEQFNEILILVRHEIEKKNTTFRQAVSAQTRLAVTLRYLATGDSYHSLEYLAKVSRKTISEFVPEVLTALYIKLQPEYLKINNTEAGWYEIIQDFWKIWNFPHTLGAIDGKHIRIIKPPNSGSDYFNFKGYHSIVLLAIVDAHSRFLLIDVGSNGRGSDNTIYENTNFFKKIDQLNIPPQNYLEGETMPVHNFFIGDDAFKLDRHMMKPYSRSQTLNTKQKVFNYRLSRARLTVECAFGRLASRFRIFHRPMDVKLETVDMIVKVCCVLHNYLTKPIKPKEDCDDLQPTSLPQTFSSRVLQNEPITSSTMVVDKMRNTIANFCIGKGDVPFQWQKIS